MYHKIAYHIQTNGTQATLNRRCFNVSLGDFHFFFFLCVCVCVCVCVGGYSDKPGIRPFICEHGLMPL